MLHCSSRSRLSLTIQVSVEVPLEVRTRVVEAELLVYAVNFLDLFRLEFEVTFKVLLDPVFGFALWENATSRSINGQSVC